MNRLFLIALALLPATACVVTLGDDPPDMTPVAAPDMTLVEAPDAFICNGTCPTCAVDETCVFYFNTFQPLFAARCLPRCQDDRDCPGARCLVVLNSSSSDPPTACVSDDNPPACGPMPGQCLDLRDHCRDAQTAAVAVPTSPNGPCGFEFVHCLKGCAGDVGDMFPAGGRCQ